MKTVMQQLAFISAVVVLTCTQVGCKALEEESSLQADDGPALSEFAITLSYRIPKINIQSFKIVDKVINANLVLLQIKQYLENKAPEMKTAPDQIYNIELPEFHLRLFADQSSTLCLTSAPVPVNKEIKQKGCLTFRVACEHEGLGTYDVSNRTCKCESKTQTLDDFKDMTILKSICKVPPANDSTPSASQTPSVQPANTQQGEI